MRRTQYESIEAKACSWRLFLAGRRGESYQSGGGIGEDGQVCADKVNRQQRGYMEQLDLPAAGYSSMKPDLPQLRPGFQRKVICGMAFPRTMGPMLVSSGTRVDETDSKAFQSRWNSQFSVTL